MVVEKREKASHKTGELFTMKKMLYCLCTMLLTIVAIVFVAPASVLGRIGEKLFTIAQHIEMRGRINEPL